jgi:hypothetical protein
MAADFGTRNEMTEEYLDWILDIRFRGPGFSVQTPLPVSREGGSIVLNALIVPTIWIL